MKEKLTKLDHKLARLLRRDEAMRYVNQLKVSLGCRECGFNKNPLALQFNHLRDKKYNISQMVQNGNPLHKIKEEIAKCEVLCANCHMIYTHTPLIQRSIDAGREI